MVTLVLGASLKIKRYSNMAIVKLVKHNFKVKAIGLREGKIATVSIDVVTSKESLKTLNYKNIHTVTIYLNAKRQKMYYNYIIALKPKRVIFNPGTENELFYKLLQENNIYFEEACTLVLLNTKQY